MLFIVRESSLRSWATLLLIGNSERRAVFLVAWSQHSLSLLDLLLSTLDFKTSQLISLFLRELETVFLAQILLWQHRQAVEQSVVVVDYRLYRSLFLWSSIQVTFPKDFVSWAQDGEDVYQPFGVWQPFV